jgi:hypothetical protein
LHSQERLTEGDERFNTLCRILWHFVKYKGSIRCKQLLSNKSERFAATRQHS